ncbi:hypothetical protein AAFM48_08150 [Burkholderia pseudomallei]
MLPFRKSIWKNAGDYHFGKCTEHELDGIAQVYAIVAAKLQIAFPTPAVCKELLAAVAAVPDDPSSCSTIDLIPMLEQYLRASKGMGGVGIPVAICVLAVVKEGRYAPVDRKTAAGLQTLAEVTEAEARHLTGTAIRNFVRVYVTKVLPAWVREIQQRMPAHADAYWGAQAGLSLASSEE